jgi:rSAM/selenodomain-associated transferase 2
MDNLLSILSRFANGVIWFFVAFLEKAARIVRGPHRTAEPGPRPWQTPLLPVKDGTHPVTVIIPTLNETANLFNTINNLFSKCALPTMLHCRQPEVIIVDGNSQDGTLSSISQLLAKYPSIHAFSQASPSRGAQQMFGASQATAGTSVFLFLHADTILPPRWDSKIVSTLSSTSSPALGTFSLSLPAPISFSLRIMLLGAKLRGKYCGLPYGDQAFFLRRSTFSHVDGFPDVPIMEDVELLKRLKRIGGTIQVLDEQVITSPRRWVKKGVWWNTMYNQCFMIAWMLGTSPETIYEWYYGVQYVKEKKTKIK